ncbi:LysR family transcriptional regulator [Vibrio sp. ZSDE26]|uniref:LysR family transcriptional regulator n=1 Tax=Vibrio amylolyticus TaxID=2847292 RepID=A0A9X2BIT0_9VIBR|nr:LysR family transcriptional regulator [Vibrio amylolyticus]MCK6262777.1 LysR family transcriptional regulator [Vibrio amylolyticus]
MPQNKHFDLNLLRVFVAVCRTGSFTKAAEELDLTQSSVSNAINRLKASIDTNLFIRSGRGVQPTAIGKSLFEQMEEPLRLLDQSIKGIDSFDEVNDHRSFNIYAFDAFIQLLAPHLEKRTSDTSIDVIMREMPGEEEFLINALHNDTADIIVDVKRPESASLDFMKIATDDLVCLASSCHPRVSKSLSREQFFEEKHVIFNLKRLNLTAFDLFTEEVLPKRRVLTEQSSMMSMLATISNTESLGVTLESYAKQFSPLFSLQTFEVPLDTKPIDIYLVWNRKFTHNAAHKWLRDLLKDIFDKDLKHLQHK